MGKITISVDEATANLLHQQGGDDVGSYIADLVRKDSVRKQAEAELGRMLDEADASGFSEKTVEDIWAEAVKRHQAKHA